MKNCWFLPLFGFFIASCSGDPTAKIQRAEADYAAAETLENSDKLIAALTEFVQKKGADPASSHRFLNRIAAVALKNHDLRKTILSAGDAVSRFGEGQNLTESIGLLAEVWHQKMSKNMDALRLEAVDERRMHVLLLNNSAWLDSAMARSEAKIMVDSTATIDGAACSRFVRMAECAAFFQNLQQKRPEKAAAALLAAGEKAMAAEQFGKSIALFERVETEFSAQPAAATALYLKAFVFDDRLKNVEKARAAYRLFLQKYPSDELAESARMSLEYLGKTDEEIIRKFDEQPNR